MVLAVSRDCGLSGTQFVFIAAEQRYGGNQAR